jgi:hypothetical protein
MYYLPNILALAGVWFTAMIVPGPDFAATVQYATAYSRRDAIFVAIGITCAISIWIIGSMAGLSILLVKLNWIVVIMRIAGAVFLGYLGITTILQADHSPTPPQTSDQAKPVLVRVLREISIPPELFGTDALVRVLSQDLPGGYASVPTFSNRPQTFANRKDRIVTKTPAGFVKMKSQVTPGTRHSPQHLHRTVLVRWNSRSGQQCAVNDGHPFT